jgi:hypothetical protein
MAICSKCGNENPDDFESCARCGAANTTSGLSGDNPAGVQDDDGLVLLANFHTVAEADMVQELLETNGINCVIRGETDPIGSRSGAEPLSLFVERQASAAATELYQAFFAGDAVVEEDSRTAETE